MELTFLQGEDQPHLKFILAVGKSWKCGVEFSSLLRVYWVAINQKRKLVRTGLQTLWSQIITAAELYSFIEKAVSNTIVEEDLDWEAVEDRSKRQLPTTITPQRSDVKKERLESDGEQLKEKRPGKVNSRKILFVKSSTVSDSSDAESWIAGIETFYTQTPEQVTLTLAGQDADILLNYCSIEDITGKPSTQLKAPALSLKPNGEVIVRKMFDNTTQANWNRQFGVLNKLVLLSD